MSENQVSPMDKLKMPISQLWAQHRTFLISFGILILIVKFRDIIIDILISSVKKTVDDAQKKDSALQQEETQANTQANELRQQAEDLSKDKPVVGEDWHKK